MSKYDDRIFKRRLRFEASEQDYTEKAVVGAYTIVASSKGFLGITSQQQVIVSPVYDTIQIDPKFLLAAVSIEVKLALMDIPT